MTKTVVPKLRQEVKVKVDIFTSDDIKIYYTGKFQDFTARYIINRVYFTRLRLLWGNICRKRERPAKITSGIRHELFSQTFLFSGMNVSPFEGWLFPFPF